MGEGKEMAFFSLVLTIDSREMKDKECHQNPFHLSIPSLLSPLSLPSDRLEGERRREKRQGKKGREKMNGLEEREL